MTKKQRTPAEIIAETEAKLDRLRIKAAKQDAMSNPTLAPLVEELQTVRVEIREAKKGLGKGPQSFDARVAKHEKWIEKIEQERSLAEIILESAELRKADIEADINAAVNKLTNTDNTQTLEA